jgi:hypothetical protein
MTNWSDRRERYLRDAVPVRLGGIAANLARVESFSDHPGHEDVVRGLVRESALFIEWTAPELASSQQACLVDLQRSLVSWNLSWGVIWQDEKRRATVAREAAEWSRRVLELSGLSGREA